MVPAVSIKDTPIVYANVNTLCLSRDYVHDSVMRSRVVKAMVQLLPARVTYIGNDKEAIASM